MNDFAAGIVLGALIVFAFVQLKRIYDTAIPLVRIRLSGGEASLLQIIFMQARRTPVSLVVDSYISLISMGETTTLEEVESVYLQRPWAVQSPDDLIDAFKESRSDKPESSP